MLAIVLSLALAQCTKDTECKGDRICSAGVCVDAAHSDEPRIEPVAPSPSATEGIQRALALGQIQQLNKDIIQLREDLDEAVLGPPIAKLVLATILSSGAVVAYVLSGSNNLGAGAATAAVGMTIGAVALYIWGGVQLKRRLRAREELPQEIALKETQIRLLKGEDPLLTPAVEAPPNVEHKPAPLVAPSNEPRRKPAQPGVRPSQIN